MTHTLLLPCTDDPGPLQAEIPAWLLHWACEPDTRCVLLRVLPGGLLGASPQRRLQARARAEAQLAGWRARLATRGLTVDTELRIGDAAEEIAKAATLLPDTTIALPTTRIRRRLRGGLAEAVMRRTDRPIVLWDAAGQAGARDRDLGRILLPVAGPGGAEPLLPDLFALAGRYAPLEVILFHDDPGCDDSGERRGPAGGQDYVRQLRARLFHAGIGSRTLIHRGGNVPLGILRAAREQGADLILMTTHARARLARLLLGSVAGTVAHLARCPVWLRRQQPIGLPLMQALEEKYLG